MSNIDYSKAVLHEDGTLHNFTLKVAGVAYHCPMHECGCNCFHKPDRTDLNIYRCNSCGATFEAK